ncbi:TRAP transporter large permease subunit, partial [Methylobacterium sp. J-067]|uniref:TRAP transporter large permease subunit n=1 Tax=Methylobacterium sp. J-067 TaxID=2836648 RepID=UPI001FBA67B6
AFIVLGSVLEGIAAVVPFGPLLFPSGRSVGVHAVHYALVVTLAMGVGLFAPPVGVGYYAACAISRLHPDAGMRPIVCSILARLVGLLAIIPVRWFPIGRSVGVHQVQCAVVRILGRGVWLFAPPFGVGYYAAAALSPVHPDAGMRPIVGYILALLVGLLAIILVPWFSIGFL